MRIWLTLLSQVNPKHIEFSTLLLALTKPSQSQRPLGNTLLLMIHCMYCSFLTLPSHVVLEDYVLVSFLSPAVMYLIPVMMFSLHEPETDTANSQWFLAVSAHRNCQRSFKIVSWSSKLVQCVKLLHGAVSSYIHRALLTGLCWTQ